MKARTLLAVGLLVLFANTAWIASFAHPTVFYMGNILVHFVLGTMLIWGLGLVFRLSRTAGWLWAVCAASALVLQTPVISPPGVLVRWTSDSSHSYFVQRAASLKAPASFSTIGTNIPGLPGARWFHLRMCASCGHIGCCDSSQHRHATAHARDTGHPIIRSAEPGEDWFWSYQGEVAFALPAS